MALAPTQALTWSHPMKLSRRSVIVGADAFAALSVPALAQEKVVRFGISMADYKFTGLTLYDPPQSSMSPTGRAS
jgi:hypothetical protein